MQIKHMRCNEQVKGTSNMNKKFYFTVAILFTLAGKTFAGNESGGGGGVTYGKNGALLVDFLNIDPDFKDSNTYEKWNASRIDKQSKFKITITRENESQVRLWNSAFDLALSTIEKWENQFLDISAGIIHSAFMHPLSWNFAPHDLTAPDSFLPVPGMQRTNIKIAAYYKNVGKDFSVQISNKIWNDLGIRSQAGLLIHESLRHLQIGWSDNFDEESLQKATALIMLCEPQSSINQYLFYTTQNRADLANSLVGNFDYILKQYCKRIL